MNNWSIDSVEFKEGHSFIMENVALGRNSIDKSQVSHYLLHFIVKFILK